MSDTVIHVENLSKRYVLKHASGRASGNGLRHAISDAVTAPFRGLKAKFVKRKSEATDAGFHFSSQEDFFALKDVSFEVKQGEVVGIIGSNGAGKSTLLKILSRITESTSGRIGIKGRVASLLEVGTGFHPELSGRENIYLNGAILGMGRTEVRSKFDEIVAFADVEKFLDTPVKHYSSGMYVRLAFAVAAHLEPDVLIIDEVLAVGDAEFQEKCLGKMRTVGQSGRTVLFVSHNMQAISILTQRCLVLKGGMCRFDGPTHGAITEYLLTSGREAGAVFTAEASPVQPRITRIEVSTSAANGVQYCEQPMQVAFRIETPVKVRGACLSFQITDQHHRPVVHLWMFDSEQPMCREPGVFKIVCVIPKLRLYMGRYALNFYFSEPPGGETFQTAEHVCAFDVVMFGRHRAFEWRADTCAYMEEADWTVNSVLPGLGGGTS